MKKLLLLFFIIFVTSCGNVTSHHQDIENLQKHYETVYAITIYEFVCIDDSGVWHIVLHGNGEVKSKIRIKDFKTPAHENTKS